MNSKQDSIAVVCAISACLAVGSTTGSTACTASDVRSHQEAAGSTARPLDAEEVPDGLWDALPSILDTSDIPPDPDLHWGLDRRQDWYELSPADQLEAQAVVAIFETRRVLDNGDGTSTLDGPKLGDLATFCASEKFADQPSGAYCSGFLVAPDVIATAGHCMNEADIRRSAFRFVFGYRMLGAQTAVTRIPNSEIYQGVNMLPRTAGDPSGSDWALVRLDRPVPPSRAPLRFRRADDRIADGEPVHAIGYPTGLPLKYAGGAKVIRNDQAAFFSFNGDVYSGNSGSPVINDRTREVEGIVVRSGLTDGHDGQWGSDFVRQGACWASRVCTELTCTGAEATRASELKRLLEGYSRAQIVAGSAHTCALSRFGTVSCFGSNSVGQLGDGTRVDRPSPTLIRGLDSVAQIAALDASTCARLRDGAVKCWGDNRFGQLGDGTREGRYSPVSVAGVSGAVDIIAAGDRFYARLGGGEVQVWGRGGIAGAVPPTAFVPELAGARALFYHPGSRRNEYATAEPERLPLLCGIWADRGIRCSGYNYYHRMTAAAPSDIENSLFTIPGSESWGAVQVSSDGFGMFARLPRGGLKTWGLVNFHLLSPPAPPSCGTPEAPTLCVIPAFFDDPEYNSTNNYPVDWGSNTVDMTPRSAPREGCLLRDNGTAACWWPSQYPFYGEGLEGYAAAHVEGLEGATQITGSHGGHICVLIDDGRGKCWGRNDYGQLGIGTTSMTYIAEPRDVRW